MENIKEYGKFVEEGINEGWLSDLFKGAITSSQLAGTKEGAKLKRLGTVAKKALFDPMIKTLQAQRDQINKKVKALASFRKADYWTLITIIACENYTSEKQGMSDTAQSIYNRFNVPGKPYGKTIREIILSKNQYEPVTKGKAKGAQWDSIDTMQDAINVYAKTKGVDLKTASAAISAAVEAQKNVTLGTNAGKHVQSRTEFLAAPPTSKEAKSPVERPAKEKHNSFFWNYAGKNQFYVKNDLKPKAKPDSVRIG